MCVRVMGNCEAHTTELTVPVSSFEISVFFRAHCIISDRVKLEEKGEKARERERKGGRGGGRSPSSIIRIEGFHFENVQKLQFHRKKAHENGFALALFRYAAAPIVAVIISHTPH